MSKLRVARVLIRSHAVVVAQRHLTGLLSLSPNCYLSMSKWASSVKAARLCPLVHVQNAPSRCSLTGLYSRRSRSTFNDIIIASQHDFYSKTST